ncbi:hypothetical protein [Streptomyces sp. NPDC096311]|uniref:hypothetical protein n=1 Tax=Streptomyces sp. NPDC096311 TaxID=3366083 RepID=UPI00380BFF1D
MGEGQEQGRERGSTRRRVVVGAGAAAVAALGAAAVRAVTEANGSEQTAPIHSWATYIGKTERYTEYYGLRLDRQGRLPGGVNGGVNGGEVLFREYYDLRADRYQLTDQLHGASAERERRLGIPEPARRLTAARAT